MLITSCAFKITFAYFIPASREKTDVELSFYVFFFSPQFKSCFQVNYETLACSKPTVDLVKLWRLLADGQPTFLIRS